MRCLALILALLSPAFSHAADVSVAAAISLKEALTEISDRYQRQSGDQVKFTFGGSGELAAQIEQGARIDLFIAAAHDQIDDLAKSKVVDGEKRVVVTRNSLVLIVPTDAKDPPLGFEDLTKEYRIAIGQPKTVPAGKYAEQVLNHYKANDKRRIVYASNVRQVLDWVERGEVAAGIVYRTDALIAGDKVRVVASADPKLHLPIEYPAVVIKNSANASAAARLLEFVQSDEAQKVFRARGFADR